MIPLIVGFGEALIDVLPTGEVVGGAPLNFSIRAAELASHLGGQAALVTRIGADARGERILTRLRQSSLDLAAVQTDSTRQTGFVDVVLNDEGQPHYTIGRQVAWENILFNESVSALAKRAGAVCFGTLVQLGEVSAETLGRFLDASQTATKILDLNLRHPWPSIATVTASLQQADVLKCNVEELFQLALWFDLDSTDDGIAVANQLQERFELRAVFWTRGAQGCCWQTGTDCVVGDVPQLDAEANADSVGAGDAASAALALGLVQGWAADRIVSAANLCGAFAASRRGATAPLSDEVLNRLK